MLVAAMNPCPCGFHTHTRTECTCSPAIVARYQKRISGPLFDRVGVFVEVPPVEYEKLVDEEPAEDSSLLREPVEVARAVQRFGEITPHSRVIPRLAIGQLCYHTQVNGLVN